MRPLSILLTFAIVVFIFVLVDQVVRASENAKEDAQVATPDDRVAVMYFHRTKRCPTCKTIGSYVEEAVKEKFAEQMKTKVVGLYFVDFQQKKNEKLAKAYKITGPTLVLVKIADNKTADWKTMPQVWKLVGDKEKFFEYVQNGVTDYLPSASEDE